MDWYFILVGVFFEILRWRVALLNKWYIAICDWPFGIPILHY